MADENEGGTSTGDLVRLVPPAILLIVVVAFALANTQKVKVDFLFTETDAPLILVLLATAVVGAIIAALVRWRRS